MSRLPQDPLGPESKPQLTSRLGYLFKHAQQTLAEFTAPALAPFGLTGRDLAVLIVLDGLGPASQQDAARGLAVDRTTMVALLDGLEAKGIVERRPAEQDRRRNVVQLTERGRRTFAAALAASDEAERAFIGTVMDEVRAAEFKELLRALVTQERGVDQDPGV
ncbi:MarR family winged helix-turn-helix transcriptional regulator [Actinospica robiniae]|uniref:MarR family winged helix-turn-helix transcriptional regulator n=1 Tax=Actinospica robiniae TaxID=304901 RepID=UPI000400DB40|nr:MarR family winged helix-turn-helix transcriptional regulator [Actinospica robiniae]